MSMNPAILDGIRVVEAASMVMVPSVGAMLAEYGADVIKVEPLDGDLNRRGKEIPGMPDHDYEYTFLPDNRNKRSISLDLKSVEGLTVFHELVVNADIFLTNYRRKALESLQIDYATLRKKNSRLIYAHGTGFGDRGREADKPGFDAVCYWSRSAMEATLFPLEGWLGPLGYGTGDHPSGMALLSSVLLALMARESTGRGSRVASSLLANGAWSNSVIIQARLCEALFHERVPREQARNFSGVYYRAGDGRIFKMTIVNGEQGWPRVCTAVGRPDMIDDPRFATSAARSGRMPEIIAILDDIFASQDMGYWQQALETHDVPFSFISTYDEVANDEQMAANEVFVEVEDPEFGRIRTTHSPLQLDSHPKVAPLPAPRLGEHSREILAELEMEEPAIDVLFERGIVR